MIINQDYSQGDLYGQYKTCQGHRWHPLENLDMLVVVNWLTKYSDLALHALGVILDGKGFVFWGESGAGKSTLAAVLAEKQDPMILGEDQVILRFLDGDFWIFSTPWHENSAMCSPKPTLLSGVFVLDRKSKIGLHKVSASDGVSSILQNAFVPFYRTELISSILDRLTLLASNLPFLN